jgi:hypothetical protein
MKISRWKRKRQGYMQKKKISHEVDQEQIGNCVHPPVTWQVTIREPKNGLRLKPGAHWS